ncbi:nucleoside diphosphate pyrophosphatase [Kitasatospora sp. CB02891]|nr:nucleoside diphosphate pyrophosphatase [Kitasatospora sp. CB02891]
MPDPDGRASVTGSSGAASVREVETVLDDWLAVRRYTLDVPGADGGTRRLHRLSVGRGDRAAVLLGDPDRGTVLLTRQLRLPVLVHGGAATPGDGRLIELPGGLTDGADPAEAARREAEEETGYRAGELTRLATVYPAPQLSTERLHLFTGEYRADDRTGPGGGVAAEGEDIEVLELPLAEAVDRLLREPAADAKTLLLVLLAHHRHTRPA